MKKPNAELASATPEELNDFADTDLPVCVMFEDPLRGPTEVDPDLVKKAEERAEKARKKRRDER